MRTLSFSVTLVLVAGLASAGAVKDQSFETHDTGYSLTVTGQYAQSFTAGLTGYLDSASFYVLPGSGTLPANLILDVMTTTRIGLYDFPDESNVLATATVASSAVPTAGGWVGFDLSAHSIWVSPGDALALRLRTSEAAAGALSWRSLFRHTSTQSDGYADGAAFVWDGTDWNVSLTYRDMTFRTFVNVVPLPSAAWLGLGLLAVAAAVRRVRRRR